MKKILVLALTLFMATSIVACAAKEEPVAETEAVTEATTEAPTTAAETVTEAATTETETEVVETDPEILGGWTDTEDGSLSEELLGYFDAATSELVGASYEPLELLGTQVVAGTNYKILCNVTAVVPDAKPEKKIVTMYVDLQKNASITEVIDAE